MILRATLLFGLCFFAWVVPRPAMAIDIPLSKAEADAAIAFGQAHTLEQIQQLRGYSFGAQDDFNDMWKPKRSPLMRVETPWLALSEAARQASAKHAEVDPGQVDSYRSSNELTIAFFVYASGRRANDRCNVVLKQGERVIDPTGEPKVQPDDRIVVRHRGFPGSPQSVVSLYETAVAATFDTRTLDVSKPFQAVVTNTPDGQWSFDVNPQALR